MLSPFKRIKRHKLIATTGNNSLLHIALANLSRLRVCLRQIPHTQTSVSTTYTHWHATMFQSPFPMEEEGGGGGEESHGLKLAVQ